MISNYRNGFGGAVSSLKQVEAGKCLFLLCDYCWRIFPLRALSRMHDTECGGLLERALSASQVLPRRTSQKLALYTVSVKPHTFGHIKRQDQVRQGVCFYVPVDNLLT